MSVVCSMMCSVAGMGSGLEDASMYRVESPPNTMHNWTVVSWITQCIVYSAYIAYSVCVCIHIKPAKGHIWWYCSASLLCWYNYWNDIHELRMWQQQSIYCNWQQDLRWVDLWQLLINHIQYCMIPPEESSVAAAVHVWAKVTWTTCPCCTHIVSSFLSCVWCVWCGRRLYFCVMQ